MESCNYNCYISQFLNVLENTLLVLQELYLVCCPDLLLVQEEAVVVLDLEIKELEIHDLGAGGLGD